MAYSDRQFKTTNIDYLNKDFDSFKSTLIEYAKTYFPNTYKDFNETSPGMMLIEMSAYVGDVLSFYIDQQYKEMMLPLAEERRNIINMANMLGYKVKPSIPAYVEITATQTVGTTGDINNLKPNYSDAIVVDKGLQIPSAVDNSIKFETLDVIDFTVSGAYDPSPVEDSFDIDGVVTLYRLTRNVRAISGETKTRDFNIQSPQQYLRLTLTETNVIEIISIEDINNGNKWYEVDYLAQDKVPVETHNIDNPYTDAGNNDLNMAIPYSLQYIKTGKRFITEVNDDNTTSIIFGNGVLRNGSIDADSFVTTDRAGFTINGTPDTSSLDISLDPLAGDSRMTLGETPANTTLRITYRTGGGIGSNVSTGDLNTSNSPSLLSGVISGKNFSVNNNFPAFGGSDEEPIEEIRRKAKAFFSTQNRCVTKEDYEARVMNMSSKFGNVAKVFVDRRNATAENSTELFNQFSASISNDNTIDISEWNQFQASAATIDVYTLGYNANKALVTLPSGSSGGITHPLKQNIITYLENYRMISDTINIADGKIINFGVAFEVVAHRSANKADVKLRCINKIIEYFNIDKMQFRQPIYTSDLEYELMGLDGVRSVNWVQLTQNFANLANSLTLTGYSGGDLLWDYNLDNNGQSAANTGNYGWFYNFIEFYTENSAAYVGPGVILPSVEPAVFELKNPRKNVRGVVK